MLRRYVHGPGLDEPLALYEGAGTTDRRWLLADERGSVIGHTDGSGTVTASNAYGPWGEPAPGNSGLFQYTGQIRLPGTRLYHYKARAYHPNLGRFLQPDPLGYAAGLNLYAYVSGDPVNLVDPLGLDDVRAQMEEFQEVTVTGQRPSRWESVDIDSVYDRFAISNNAFDEAPTPNLCGGQEPCALQPGGMGRVLSDFLMLSITPAGKAKAAVVGVQQTIQKGIIAKGGLRITGYTKHGVNRAIGDAAKRAGTSPRAIRDALTNPVKMTTKVDKSGPSVSFVGKDAKVVVNPDTGRIISVNPLSGSGVR